MGEPLVPPRALRREVASDVLEGGCACGEVRYRLTSDPLFTHCCHCLNCQRQTGSAFVVNVLIEADRVELLAGEPKPVDVPRSGGKKQRIFRCPTCEVARLQPLHPRERSCSSAVARSTTRRAWRPTSTSTRGRS